MVLVFVEVLVGQSTKRVAKLMHNDRLKEWVVSRRERVRVVYSASAVSVGVGKYNQMLVVDAHQRVVNAMHAIGCEVAWRVEGVKIGV